MQAPHFILLPAHQQVLGSVILVTCPVVLPARDSRALMLSVRRSEQLVVLGTDPNFSICSGRRKDDGAPCTMAVCKPHKYCTFHLTTELKVATHRVASGRADLTSSAGGGSGRIVLGAIPHAGGHLVPTRGTSGVPINASSGVYGRDAMRGISREAAAAAADSSGPIHLSFGTGAVVGGDADGYGYSGPVRPGSDPGMTILKARAAAETEVCRAATTTAPLPAHSKLRARVAGGGGAAAGDSALGVIADASSAVGDEDRSHRSIVGSVTGAPTRRGAMDSVFTAVPRVDRAAALLGMSTKQHDARHAHAVHHGPVSGDAVAVQRQWAQAASSNRNVVADAYAPLTLPPMDQLLETAHTPTAQLRVSGAGGLSFIAPRREPLKGSTGHRKDRGDGAAVAADISEGIPSKVRERMLAAVATANSKAITAQPSRGVRATSAAVGVLLPPPRNHSHAPFRPAPEHSTFTAPTVPDVTSVATLVPPAFRTTTTPAAAACVAESLPEKRDALVSRKRQRDADNVKFAARPHDYRRDGDSAVVNSPSLALNKKVPASLTRGSHSAGFLRATASLTTGQDAAAAAIGVLRHATAASHDALGELFDESDVRNCTLEIAGASASVSRGEDENHNPFGVSDSELLTVAVPTFFVPSLPITAEEGLLGLRSKTSVITARGDSAGSVVCSEASPISPSGDSEATRSSSSNLVGSHVPSRRACAPGDNVQLRTPLSSPNATYNLGCAPSASTLEDDDNDLVIVARTVNNGVRRATLPATSKRACTGQQHMLSPSVSHGLKPNAAGGVSSQLADAAPAHVSRERQTDLVPRLRVQGTSTNAHPARGNVATSAVRNSAIGSADVVSPGALSHLSRSSTQTPLTASAGLVAAARARVVPIATQSTSGGQLKPCSVAIAGRTGVVSTPPAGSGVASKNARLGSRAVSGSTGGFAAIMGQPTPPALTPQALAPRSRNAEEGVLAVIDRALERSDDLARLEVVHERMADVTSREVRVYCCLTCEKFTRTRPELCEADGHKISTTKKKEWRFECTTCHHRQYHDSTLCVVPCPKCSKSVWVKASIYNVPGGAGGGNNNVAPLASELRTHGDPVTESLRGAAAHSF